MIVKRLMDGSISISSVIDGHLVTKKYYLEGSNQQNLKEAYKAFLREYKDKGVEYEI
jgi:hypothetical protein